MKLKRKNNKGFTLIEIIVVLVIMVIMAAIAIPAVTGYIKDAKDSKYIQETDSIYTIVQTEEAKAKALGQTPINYTNMVATVNKKLEGTGVTVASIEVAGEKYTITFTSDKKVAVTFTKNKDDMKVEDVPAS